MNRIAPLLLTLILTLVTWQSPVQANTTVKASTKKSTMARRLFAPLKGSAVKALARFKHLRRSIGAFCVIKRPRTKKKPVLVYTDDGRDVDDIEAITYLAGSKKAYVAGVVTTHMIPDRRANIARAVMHHLGDKKNKVPIGVGSVFPTGKEDEALVKYLREHTIKGRSYEGEGLIECFPNSTQVIQKLIKKHGSDLSIAVLAPMTDLAKAVQKDPKLFAKVGGLYIQGQAIVGKDGKLAPDPAAYNLKEDMKAAEIVFGLQDKVKLTLVGKHAAYQAPLTRDDFGKLARTGHPVGKYLKTHAEKGLECFVRRAPEIFKKVFKVPAEQDAYEGFKKLKVLSNPYDAVTVQALTQPELLKARRVGKHCLIGSTAEDTGVPSAAKLKADLMGTMLRALKR